MAYVNSKNKMPWQLKSLTPNPNETGSQLSSCYKMVCEGKISEDPAGQYPPVSDNNWIYIFRQVESQLGNNEICVFRIENTKEEEEERTPDTSIQMNEMLQKLSEFDQRIKNHDEKIKRIEDENQQLKIRYDTLDSEYRSVQHENRQMREQLRRQGRRMGERVVRVEQGQKRLDELNMRTISELERQTRRSKISPGKTSIINLENGITWSVEDIDAVLEGKKDEWGPCFYVRDYKFQLNIAANVEKGYLSFYVALIKGLHDDELEWPFEGEFTFLLNNRENPRDVYRKEFVSTTQQANDNFIKPVEMKNVPIGFPKFISIDSLKQAKYTLDGSIKLTLLVNPKLKKDCM